MKKTLALVLSSIFLSAAGYAGTQTSKDFKPYLIGLNDVLNISIIKPDKYEITTTVAPDGTINFPYIGSVPVKGSTVIEVQMKIEEGLAERMPNPVVLVSLVESRNRQFYAYGEVMRPGPYPIAENLTVIEALSMAGGYSKFGSASKVKVMRKKEDGTGNEIIKVDVNAAMRGEQGHDIFVQPGDVITVSEGVF